MKFMVATVLSIFSVGVLADSWGGALSLDPAKTNIIKATTTLTPGAAPFPQTGELFLWPGMSNGTGDLIQTTLESWPDNTWCGATPGQWCVRASVFGGFGQIDSTTTQTVSIAGKVVATLNHDSGPFMKGWGTGTECDGGCSGSIAAQTYTNTTIMFDAADPNFVNTLVLSGGTTFTGFANQQGGKVWTIASIHIPAMV
ncbi:hypothetical protein DFH08DRAFT_799290 [Mycena albidolilacea]|uniref:Uncharacterized protein n=1 Tax=Mycena albidolilacea TaxID=1033008 RepID=A0AAD7AMH2_9AGAR|nr:hypothetical protein DFH08DRAFT_799290 [Mycena albidolilacea]